VAVLEAARHFQHRLPEVFAGFPRDLTSFPVEYPTACSPQAWAAGTPLLLLRVMLGLDAQDGKLQVDPHVPDGVGAITATGVRGQWGRADARAT
ncbi:MAG: amylo-alpha-1,6-glucosidase, partial [Actinomycetes bacterium]